MYERSHVSVKVEPRSTSRLISTLYILPLFDLRDYNLRALTRVAKNARKRQKVYILPGVLNFQRVRDPLGLQLHSFHNA